MPQRFADIVADQPIHVLTRASTPMMTRFANLVAAQVTALLIPWFGAKMNALQQAVASLTTAVTALTAAVQANTFSAADVANINAQVSAINALASSFTPPAPPAPPAS